jgi:hypothetical protein
MLPFIKSAPKVPGIAEVSPEFAVLLKRQELLTKLWHEAIEELRSVGLLNDAKPPMASPTPTIVDVERRRRVEALLKGEPYEASPLAIEEPQPSSRYWELKRQISDIDFVRAEVQARLNEVASAASAIIREKFRDPHREMVRKMAAALRTVHEANELYWEFSDAMAGIPWGALGPAFVRPIGHPKDRSCPLGYWFREALADGHISKSDIPASLR